MGSGDSPVISVASFTNIVVFWRVRVFLKCIHMATFCCLWCTWLVPRAVTEDTFNTITMQQMQ